MQKFKEKWIIIPKSETNNNKALKWLPSKIIRATCRPQSDC